MDLADIREEVKERGFNFVDDARINRWVNRAYHRICDRHPWGFLEATATGTSPLEISDLRAVFSVVDTTGDTPLEYADIRSLREIDPSLDETGSPYCWYRSSPTEITAYPTASGNTLSVRYIQVPADLADGTEPVFPSRFHYTIVEGACGYAYRDSDNAEFAKTCDEEFEVGIQDMADAILVPNYDSLASMVVYYDGSTDW